MKTNKKTWGIEILVPHLRIETDVLLAKDGDQWGAVIGDLPTGLAGFGDTPSAALRALAADIEKNDPR